MSCSNNFQVYSVIEETGKMGIALREIRTKTGLTQLQIKRALNAVENRKLVKSVKVITPFFSC